MTYVMVEKCFAHLVSVEAHVSLGYVSLLRYYTIPLLHLRCMYSLTLHRRSEMARTAVVVAQKVRFY